MGLPETFRTSRLLLTRISADDAADLVTMQRDPGVAATLGGMRAEDEIEADAQMLAAQWDAHGFGWWAVREPGTGRFIGRGGLRYATVGAERAIEVGFGFMPEFWGRGLATELARVSVAQGIVRLGAAEIVSFTLPSNAASRRVMEKTGFAYERDIEHAGMPHVLYRLTAESWRTAPVREQRSAARRAAAEQALAV